MARSSRVSRSSERRGDGVLERLAFEALHGDEGVAVFLADVVDGADVGVIERGGGLGFALEAGERLRVFGDGVGEEFQSDETIEAGVFGFVDDAHAAAAEFFEDAVMGDSLADLHWGFGHVGNSRGMGGKSTKRGRRRCEKMTAFIEFANGMGPFALA